MDLFESGDDDNSTERKSGDEDNSTEIESRYDESSTESESGDDNNSTESSTTEDVWDDMILEVYNTEDYATKVSEYVMNDYQNSEENAKRDMLEVYSSDLKFNNYKLLLTYHRMQASKMHKKIMTDVKSCTSATAIDRLSDRLFIIEVACFEDFLRMTSMMKRQMMKRDALKNFPTKDILNCV